MKSMTFLIVQFILLAHSQAANIIVLFPINVKSHSLFSDAMVSSLVEAGHDVTYLMSNPSVISSANFTVIDIRDDLKEPSILVQSNLDIMPWFYVSSFTTSKIKNEVCYSRKVEIAMERLKNLEKKFDLLIIPVHGFVECLLPIAEEFDVPIIGAALVRTWLYADLMVANPRNPAIVPFDYSISFLPQKFCSRFSNTINHLLGYLILHVHDTSFFHPHVYASFPNFDVTRARKISLLFQNHHHSILPKPIAPNTVEVGGLHISPVAGTLPPQIKTFIDDAEHRVILVSLGTLIQASPKIRDIFLNVFANISERVIWKSNEKFENLPENILVLKWLPQRDILAHKNVKAFVTHCGFFGTQEAIYEGKPLIMIPFYYDQPGTAALMDQKGVGVLLQHQTLTERKLLSAIRDVIDDEGYRLAMQNLSRLYKDRPMNPRKALVYWTEYVIRHKGSSHLRTAAADVPFYQYFLLDQFLNFVGIDEHVELCKTGICGSTQQGSSTKYISIAGEKNKLLAFTRQRVTITDEMTFSYFRT